MLKRLFGSKDEQGFITVVSGLPRSGTSMMMKMLEAGGIPPIQDGIRTADVDNPKGYYEFERIKQLDKGDVDWLPDAKGKAVKAISALLVHLPEGFDYRVLFMRRDLDEVLASQSKMLKHREEEQKVNDDTMKALYGKHVLQVEQWMNNRPNVRWMNVDYRELVQNPMTQLPRIDDLLSNTMDVEAMAAIADPDLYRNRQK